MRQIASSRFLCLCENRLLPRSVLLSAPQTTRRATLTTTSQPLVHPRNKRALQLQHIQQQVFQLRRYSTNDSFAAEPDATDMAEDQGSKRSKGIKSQSSGSTGKMLQEKIEDNATVVVVEGARYKTAKEGLASIYVPLSGGDRKERQNGGGGPAVDDHPQQVFYNPIQQFNRDLSVLAIKAYGTSVVEKRQAAFARKKEFAASKKRKRAEEKKAAAVEGAHTAETDTDTAEGGKAAETTEVAAEVATAEAVEEDRPAKVEKLSEADDAASSVTELVSRGAEAKSDATDTHITITTERPAQPPAQPSSPHPIRILDALSATGLRALRYAHELPFNVSVTANDLLPAATEAIRRNVKMNGLQDKINVTQSDAVAHMYTVVAQELTANASGDLDKKEKKTRRSNLYDVIDLDPYGTGANFFDAAIQSVRHDGGLLCVTCTDAGVWASQGYPEKCFSLYGGVPMKGAHSHEAGLRIILHSISTAAARYGFMITPLLSLSIDFYCRVFVTVTRSPASVKFLAGKTMVAYNCDYGCGAWTTQPLLKNRFVPNKKGTGTFPKFTFASGPTAESHCEHCHSKTHIAGPMYAGPLHQADFVNRILDDLPHVDKDVYGTTSRIRGMLQTALEELLEHPADSEGGEGGAGAEAEAEAADGSIATSMVDPTPFFFLPTNLAKVVHCSTPGEDAIRGALISLGYQVTRSHCKGGSVKTDAPWSVLWDVMRAWVHQKAPVMRKNINPSTAAYRLLRIEEEDKAEAKAKEEGREYVPAEDTSTNAEGKTQAVVFDEELGRAYGRGEKLVRYQLNPRENWGPMNRAKGK
ncbi:dimethylguanosine trna methyltransferase [Ophiostoma piceae UAMH 11346]|uniref:tRNA (guanine(26)-N(2))-dimethyltransferase n=1 Tax=Ophiostoma piceae (strain UAMH 11346) TaxID=1262450 RepID=S3BSG1_OPHP1|nr:dimethylguanosine trna methyltransferase [Ophiostoma piceae UAMH 11346]